MVYYCNGTLSLRPTDLNDPYGGAPTVPADLIPENPFIPGQDKSPINPQKFVDCFTLISNVEATYKVIVQVQEPMPGTRLNVGINSIGHSAITIIKSGSNGQSITQTVGFYPAGTSYLEKIAGPSKMVNNAKAGADGNEVFTVSMEFNGLTATNFNSILAAIASPPTEYNLFGMNCTSFVVGACSSGGITLPSALNGVATVWDPLNLIQTETPAGLGASMREAKANGDSRVKTNQSAAPTSKGPCN